MFAVPPGAAEFDSQIPSQLSDAYEKKKSAIPLRTRHRDADGHPKYVNRLILERSPYLLQHAHNPVSWRAWSEETFALARKLDRPILLSVGYSTCHWCHVMEEESFEDEEIAALLNSHFIPVKVDREERPDVDSVYMKAVQMMTGQGGWPMTVCLTPDLKPFFGGTYFPARDGDRGGVGFLTILRRLSEVYRTQRGRVTDSAEQMAAIIKKSAGMSQNETMPDAGTLHQAFNFYQMHFDERFGGMTGAPKFPSSLPIRFLLRYARRTGNKEALGMAEKTLVEMARGGMYDQIGGGFHRYSTDERWLVPHFEKMLYDNALSAVTYLEAWQMTRNAEFAYVAKDILKYIQREMTSQEGAFYSATDADSLNDDGEPEEGFFFTWRESEIASVLSVEEFAFAREYFNFSGRGNLDGRNILYRSGSPREESPILIAVRRKLYEARKKRIPPLRDEKILASWNSLMISSFARAGFAFDDHEFIDAAVRAAEFLSERMMMTERPAHAWFKGEAGDAVYLDDYAFFLASLLDLFEATRDPRWLEKAARIKDEMTRRFHDESEGGFFLSENGDRHLLAREKPAYDGAEPCGNSIAALSLLRLYDYSNDARDREPAHATLQAFTGRMTQAPYALSEMLSALDHYLDRPLQIVIVTPPESDEGAKPLLDVIRGCFLPDYSLVVAREGEGLSPPFDARLLEGKKVIGGRAAAYVCRRGACFEPVNDPGALAAQLSIVEPY